MKVKYKSMQFKPADIAKEPDTFAVALFAYFGMSNHAIITHMRHMNQGKIQYRLKKARERFNINVRRSDYRDGNNALARRVIQQFRGFGQKRLTMGDLR
jgi:hypothetical protein